ncbi:MAG: hypothetical protein LBN33_05775 [Desulfovibrio sp.]|jgi:uncharacterized membrane protein HdeD (DUF308 family)|nr:hypothetical protein [Desulfovibrio sp.]
MIQLFLVLCGSRLIRKRWWILFSLGVLWVFIGGFLFLDALDGSLVVPIIYYTIPLALEGAWALLSSPSRVGGGRTMRLAEGIICLLLVLLIIFVPRHSVVIIGFLVGLFLCLDALWRAASAWVVRYDGWRGGLFFAVLEFLFGAWAFVPWPTDYAGGAGIDTGTLLSVSGFALCSLSLRIRRLPRGLSILSILNRWEKGIFIDNDVQECEYRETALVHIWTPTLSVVPVNRGVSRYIAAEDENGVASAGHAALELASDLYISHYPALEIDRSGSEFARVLRATPDNDVPGLFQPSYAKESAEWCPSTVQVPLQGLNGRAIRRFWRKYSEDSTYNLTRRSCASTVAKALDAGLDGIFAQKARSPLFLLRLLLAPELRVAGFMRRNAMSMAWTPGLMLDYARALRLLVTVMGEAGEGSAAPDNPHADNRS